MTQTEHKHRVGVVCECGLDFDEEFARLWEEPHRERDRLLDEFSEALRERGAPPQRQVYPFADALDELLAAHRRP